MITLKEQFEELLSEGYSPAVLQAFQSKSYSPAALHQNQLHHLRTAFFCGARAIMNGIIAALNEDDLQALKQVRQYRAEIDDFVSEATQNTNSKIEIDL